MSSTSSASGTSFLFSARPFGVKYTYIFFRFSGTWRRVTYPSASIDRRAVAVVGSMTPASADSSYCVTPSCSQRMRRKAQCPNDTECWASRTWSARTSARVVSLMRCASRSFGTASQCRKTKVRDSIDRSDFFLMAHPPCCWLTCVNAARHAPLGLITFRTNYLSRQSIFPPALSGHLK